jgi:hypothetical protein
MMPRKVDLAFDWMCNHPRRAFHYGDDDWAALARLHADERAVTNERRTPGFSLHRDMEQDASSFRSMLEQVGDWPVRPSKPDSSGSISIQVMRNNVELLDVCECDGDLLRLTSEYQSKSRAHPGQQNRGEKPYRVRLSQVLPARHGGEA